MNAMKTNSTILSNLLLLTILLLSSCSGGSADPDDTAKLSAWSEWTPTTTAETEKMITQTRTRTCVVTVNGNADSPAPTCSGSITDTQIISNPDYDINLDAPTAHTATATIDEDNAVSFALTATDPNGNTFSFSITSQPSNGAVTIDGATATYTPNSDFNGVDEFVFVATNSTDLQSNAITATITVTAVNDPPVANSATIVATEDIARQLVLTATDVDGDTVSFSITSQPSKGTVTIDGAAVTYTPNANFSGSDSFTFVAIDSNNVQSATATISITVDAVNDPLVAINQSLIVQHNTSLTITLSATDVEVGSTFSFSISSQTSNGTATILVQNGTTASLNYQPNPDYSGSDTFTFEVSDGTDSSTATVSLATDQVIYLSSNGITIRCPNANDGDTGTIGGTTYTKLKSDATIQDFKNANVQNICTSGITDMTNIFNTTEGAVFNTNFNENITHWDTSNVTSMSSMFVGSSSFNRDLSAWDTSNVTNMSFMFNNADAFNQDIGGWDVSNVTNMNSMFRDTLVFNPNIGGWDVSSVTDMASMFRFADAFNQDIGDWDVSSVTDMASMFRSATAFDQDLSGWCVTDFSSEPSQFDDSTSSNWTSGEKPVWGTCPPNTKLWSANSFNPFAITPLVLPNAILWDAPAINTSIDNSIQTITQQTDSVAKAEIKTKLTTTAQAQCLIQDHNSWLVPTNDGSVLDSNNSYRWGDEVYGDWDEYLNYAEQQSLCGFDNWRVPTAIELQQLLQQTGSYQALQQLLPYVLPHLYWTSNEVDSNTGEVVNMVDGSLQTALKYKYHKLLLVRTSVVSGSQP